MIDTSLTSSNFYFMLAVVQGLVLTGLIIFNKPFKRPNLYLGLLIALFSMSLLHLVLEESIHAFNAKFPIPMEFSMAYGPLAYLHIISIKNPRQKFKGKDLLHFLPSLFFDCLLFTSFFIFVGSNMEWAYGHIPEIQQGALIVAMIGSVQLLIYTVLTYRESQSAQHTLKEFGTIRKWLKTILIFWIVIISFLAIIAPFGLLNADRVDDNSYLIYKPLGTIIGLCIYGMGYTYLLKYIKPVRSYMERIQKFKFSPADFLEKKQEILDMLATKKVHRDSSITIAKLAGQIGWPINDLSVMINEVLKTNFNDLINKERVKDFTELATQPESKKYSLVGLGEQVGFSSKASFYRAFKKETGLTPSAYIKEKGL